MQKAMAIQKTQPKLAPLPVKPGPSKPSADTAPTVESKGGKGMVKRVFVIDDEALIADTLAAILNMSGYQAIAFYDGQSALSACEFDEPAFIISDVMMPEMSGIELAIHVKEKFPDCRVLLFSGQAASYDLLKEAESAGHDFELLLKPVHPKDLLARLETSGCHLPFHAFKPQSQMTQ